MPKKVFPATPVQRLVNPKLPNLDIPRTRNPQLNKLIQVPELGWRGCTPQDPGRKLKESLDGIAKYHLLEHIAHAKRRIRENITQYIDGKLPVWIRKFKYTVDVIRVIQYAQRLVATARFLQAQLRKEIELANHYANECNSIVNWMQLNLTTAALRTEAESGMVEVWNRAAADLEQQVNENSDSLQCLI